MSTLSQEQINEIIRNRLKQALDEDDEIRLEQPRRFREDAEEASWLHQDFAVEMQTALAENDYASWAHLVDRIIKEAGVQLDRDSEDYRRFYREVLKSHSKLAEVLAGREMGNYEVTRESAEKVLNEYSTAGPADAKSEQQPSGPTVSEVFQKYKTENVTNGIWTEKTTEEIGTSIQLFIDVIGDLNLDAITRKTVVDYKDTLMQLPPNLKKAPRYREKTIPEILEMDGVEPMAPRTINKQLSRISALFNWAFQNAHMESNPADGLKVKLGKQVLEDREPFTNDNLNRIFSASGYLDDSFSKAYMFWTPVIGLYTGCRLDEICQLHLEDIRMECGVWVFDINDGPDRKLKNASSRRLVPLHPFLADDLNLPGYVERMRTQGHRRLFPELSRGRDGYSKNVSTWFRRWRKSIGVDKPFHSFRHTFIGHLKDSMVDPVMLQEVAGHTVDSMTFGTYSQKYKADKVYEELILKIDYGIDLNHLKESRFVRCFAS